MWHPAPKSVQGATFIPSIKPQTALYEKNAPIWGAQVTERGGGCRARGAGRVPGADGCRARTGAGGVWQGGEGQGEALAAAHDGLPRAQGGLRGGRRRAPPQISVLVAELDVGADLHHQDVSVEQEQLEQVTSVIADRGAGAPAGGEGRAERVASRLARGGGAGRSRRARRGWRRRWAVVRTIPASSARCRRPGPRCPCRPASASARSSRWRTASGGRSTRGTAPWCARRRGSARRARPLHGRRTPARTR